MIAIFLDTVFSALFLMFAWTDVNPLVRLIDVATAAFFLVALLRDIERAIRRSQSL